MAVNVARAGCCRCPNALVVSGPDAGVVLLALLEALEAEGWSLDALGRRVCAACSTPDEDRARGAMAGAAQAPAGAMAKDGQEAAAAGKALEAVLPATVDA
jgi:hypothetical protein